MHMCTYSPMYIALASSSKTASARNKKGHSSRSATFQQNSCLCLAKCLHLTGQVEIASTSRAGDALTCLNGMRARS